MATTTNITTTFVPKYEIGTRIKIISRPNKYRNYDIVGKYGVVRSTNVDSMAVLIDGVENRTSAYGYFYLSTNNIKYTDEQNYMEEKTMSTITNYLNAVRIQFVGDVNPCTRLYANFDPDIKVGDLCVVKPAHHTMSLARIVEIIEDNTFEITREIVAKVETGAYDTRVECRAKAAELKTKMQERAKQLQDVALYQMLAKDDPDMQALLNEYQSLPKI